MDDVEVCEIATPITEITLSSPATINQCEATSFDVSISGAMDGTFNSGSLVLPVGVDFLSVTAITGATVSVDLSDVISITNITADTVDFTINVKSSCEQAAGIEMIGVLMEYLDCNSMVVDLNLQNTVTLTEPDVTITSSSPTNISLVTGQTFMVTTTVNNGGNGSADSTFYCVNDNANATLVDVTVGGMSLVTAPSSPAGQTCYLLPSPFGIGTNYVIIETWTVDNCTVPEEDVSRSVSVVCEGLMCLPIDEAITDIDFNVTDPLVILQVVDPTFIDVCGASQTISVSIKYTDDYPGIDLENILAEITLPTGVSIVALNNIVGGTATLNGTDVEIGDLASDATITFDIIIEADCSTTNPINFTIDLSYDPLCPSTNDAVTYTSGNIPVNTPNISISATNPPFFNGQIGLEQMITSTVNNTGSSSADTVFYCVFDNANATLTNITIGGVPLALAASSPSGQTCYLIPGGIAMGTNKTVIETWEIVSCNMTSDPLRRRAQFGCKGDMDCQDKPQLQFPSTTISYTVPDPILDVNVTTANVVNICGPEETVNFEITYTNSQAVTLTGVGIEIVVPSNIDIINITSISGGTVTPNFDNTILTVTDLAPNTTLAFDAQIQSGCGVAGSNVKVTANVTHDALCEGANTMATGSSDNISLQSASLSIISGAIMGNLRPSMNVFDAILDVADTLKVPLVNAGIGGINEFTYFVVNPPSLQIQSLLVGGLEIPVASTNGDTVFYLVNEPFIMKSMKNNVLDDGDGTLEENEILLFCEVWLGTECQSGQLDPIKRGSWFGCQGQKCGSSNVSSTGINFDFAGPDLAVSIYDPYTIRPACYAVTNTQYGFRVINNGNAKAKDLSFSLNQETAAGAIVGSSLKYAINDPNGPFIATTIGDNNPTSGGCVNNLDNYESLEATMIDVDLMPGDSLFFQYEIDHSCNCRGCDVLYIHGNNVSKIEFTDPCDRLFTDNTDYVRERFNAGFFGFNEGESNSGPAGDCIRYAVTDAQNTWFSGANRALYPKAYLELQITVECGLDVDASTIKWVDADGTIYMPTIIAAPDNGAAGDDVIIVRFGDTDAGGDPYPAGFSLQGNTGVEFCYVPDCSEKPSAGCSSTSSFTFQPYFVTDPSCDACTEKADCASPFPITYDCPGCTTCDGITHTELDIRRVNYGSADLDNNQIPDGGAIDPLTIQAKRFLTGDTLKASFEGRVNDSDNSEVWTNAFATIDINTNLFTILGGELKVYDANNGNAELTCTVLSQFADGNKLVTDLSSGVLSSLSCGDFTGFEYQDGDSISLCVYFTTKDELLDEDNKAMNYETWFYLSDDAYALGDTARCNFLFENLQQIGIRSYHNDVISGADFGGCDISPFELRSDLYYGALRFDEFPNEIRPIGYPDNVIFKKPTNFAFRNDQHRFRYRIYTGVPEVDITTFSAVVPTRIFLRRWR